MYQVYALRGAETVAVRDQDGAVRVFTDQAAAFTAAARLKADDPATLYLVAPAGTGGRRRSRL